MRNFIRDFVEFFLSRLNKNSPGMVKKFTSKNISNLIDDDINKIWALLTNKGGKNLGQIIWSNNVISPTYLDTTFQKWIDDISSASSKEEKISMLVDRFENANILDKWMQLRGHSNPSEVIKEADLYLNSKLEEAFLKKVKSENKQIYDLYKKHSSDVLQSKIENIANKWDKIDLKNPFSTFEKIILSDGFLLKTIRSLAYEVFTKKAKTKDEIIRKLSENLKALTKGGLKDGKKIQTETILLLKSLRGYQKAEIDTLLGLIQKEISKVLQKQGAEQRIAETKSDDIIAAIKKSNPYEADRWNKILGDAVPSQYWGNITTKVLKWVETIVNLLTFGSGPIFRDLSKRLSKYGYPRAITEIYLFLQLYKFLSSQVVALFSAVWNAGLASQGKVPTKDGWDRLVESFIIGIKETYMGETIPSTILNILVPINAKLFFDDIWNVYNQMSKGEIKISPTPQLSADEMKAIIDSAVKVQMSKIDSSNALKTKEEIEKEVKMRLDSLSKNKFVNKEIEDSLNKLNQNTGAPAIINFN